jgi:hypothetical protein
MDKLNYSKITEEDIQIAENFFNNDKQLDEFLANVTRYYSGRSITAKTQIVLRYLQAYMKTMDFVIAARSKGKLGGSKRVENQSNRKDTLKAPFDTPSDILQPNIKDKVISNNIKTITKGDSIRGAANKLKDLFNSEHGTKTRIVSEKTVRQLKTLIEAGYTVENVIEASKELKKEKWLAERGFKELNIEFITRADKMEKYFNQVTASVPNRNMGANEYMDNYLKRIAQERNDEQGNS